LGLCRRRAYGLLWRCPYPSCLSLRIWRSFGDHVERRAHAKMAMSPGGEPTWSSGNYPGLSRRGLGTRRCDNRAWSPQCPISPLQLISMGPWVVIKPWEADRRMTDRRPGLHHSRALYLQLPDWGGGRAPALMPSFKEIHGFLLFVVLVGWFLFNPSSHLGVIWPKTGGLTAGRVLFAAANDDRLQRQKRRFATGLDMLKAGARGALRHHSALGSAAPPSMYPHFTLTRHLASNPADTIRKNAILLPGLTPCCSGLESPLLG